MNFIEDFLNNFVGAKNIIIFSCSSAYNLQQLAYLLSNLNIYFKFIFILKLDDFTKTIAGQCIFLVDYSCSDSSLFLLESSKFNYYNSSYHWIIFNELNKSSDVIFDNIPNIGINSNINLISKNDKDTYEIDEIYRRGAAVIKNKTGFWNLEEGLKLFNPVTFIFNHKNRGDLQELQLRGGFDDSYNLSSEFRYHAVVSKLLMQAFNFKYVT